MTGTKRVNVDSAAFRHVLGHLPTAVTVVASLGPDGPTGLAIGSFFSVSLDPPLVGFCVARTSSSWPSIKAAGSFCVNVLAVDQEAVCRTFASRQSNKFAGVAWKRAPVTGSPHLDGVLAWIDCDVDAVHDAGDHELCIGRVHQLGTEGEGAPLLFYRGGYRQLSA